MGVFDILSVLNNPLYE